MTNDFINSNGIQTSISNTGVLLSYSVNSKDTIELYFNSLEAVLKQFKIERIDDLTGISIMNR